MIVYRVETYTGEGPYLYRPWSPGPSYSQRNWPLPTGDELDNFPDFYSFGFASIRQFKHWFQLPDRLSLDRAGLKLAWYEVPMTHVRFGLSQLCFDRGLAVKLKQERTISHETPETEEAAGSEGWDVSLRSPREATVSLFRQLLSVEGRYAPNSWGDVKSKGDGECI